ncbi:coiled-coil domain-containing protein 153 [Chelmon rostratus]|uniref:coiled-coil domain-containing protein 153 n=1 Tax=Chelmon rostratus TaxID=109905 RepID=UPI001BE673F5|nr:coiled-coil domain-containing protein 153 [Chelmon rostratus]
MATHSATRAQQQRLIPVCCQCMPSESSQQEIMPPKKKTKKTTKKNPEKSENDLEAKYRRSVLDIAILQDHIAFQRESVINVQSDRAALRRHMRDVEQKLQHERQDHRDINSDLSRQYKTMQMELTNRVKRLEKEVSQLKEELVLCQEELGREKRQREQVEQEKDVTIADLQHKLDNMETNYEKILHETLDGLTSQLCVARQRWQDKSTTLHQNYKELLSEFGLNTLDV